MKRASKAQSATSLDMAPEDDENLRIRNYLLTMGIRTACVILCAVVVPYGWHTAVFAVGAIFLPYVAVVVANVAAAPAERAVPPERALEAPRAERVDTGLSPAVPDVIRLQESPPRPAAGGEGERR